MELSRSLACVCIVRGLSLSCNLNSTKKNIQFIQSILLWTIIISFTFEQVISGFPAVLGAPSDIGTEANSSLPKCNQVFCTTSLGCFYDEAPLSAKEVDMHKIKNSGPV